MAPEVWGMVGVIVGAIIGGGAQVRNGQIQERHALERERRQAARDAVVEAVRLSTAFVTTVGSLLDVVDLLADRAPVDDPNREWLNRDFAKSAQEFAEARAALVGQASVIRCAVSLPLGVSMTSLADVGECVIDETRELVRSDAMAHTSAGQRSTRRKARVVEAQQRLGEVERSARVVLDVETGH